MNEKLRVIIDNQQNVMKIPTGVRMLVRRCCNAVLQLEKFEGPAEISVTFTDNANPVLVYIRKIQAYKLAAPDSAVQKQHQDGVISFFILTGNSLQQSGGLL